jgi:hypothetical protein
VQGEHDRHPRAFAAGDGLAADPVAAIGQEDVRPENLQPLRQERKKRETFGPGRVAAVGDGWAVDGDGHVVLAEIGDGERHVAGHAVADDERNPLVAEEIAWRLVVDEIQVRTAKDFALPATACQQGEQIARRQRRSVRGIDQALVATEEQPERPPVLGTVVHRKSLWAALEVHAYLLENSPGDPSTCVGVRWLDTALDGLILGAGSAWLAVTVRESAAK